MRVDRVTALKMMTNLLELRRRRGLISSSSDPVSFYGFSPEDILCIHFWKQEKEGIWFRLSDSVVINGDGKPDDADISLYQIPKTPQYVVF